VVLAPSAGGEIESVCAPYPIPSEGQRPESGVDYHVSCRVCDLAEKASRRRIKSVDDAVAKVADKNGIAEGSEVSACLNDSPGRIEGSMGDKTSNESAVLVKNVHDAVPWANLRMASRCVLQCVRDENLAADLLNVERRIAGGEIVILERA